MLDKIKSIKILLFITLLPFNSFAFEDKEFFLDINHDSVNEKIISNPIENYLYIYDNKGNIVVKTTNFTVDGYSTFKEIVSTKDGFYIVNKASGFDSTFNIYISLEKSIFTVKKIESSYNDVSDGIFSITQNCTKNVNSLLDDIDISSLEPLLSGNEKDLDRYCKTKVFTENNLLWFEKSIKNKEVVINNNFIEYLTKSHPISKSNQVTYNNIAYYLANNGYHEDAIKILKEIIRIVPSRIVAYINIADSYSSVGEIKLAEENYRHYYNIMKKNGKIEKIPERVFDKINIDK
jgi:tetratricopeptide (TPR) repeat protein